MKIPKYIPEVLFDDSNITSVVEHARASVTAATQRSVDFDRVSGQLTNLGKTVASATTPELGKVLGTLAVQGQQLTPSAVFKLLGAHLGITEAPADARAETRCQACVKIQVITAGTLPMLCGVEVVVPMEKRTAMFATQIIDTLW
ncbi:unnamed protein product, partial [Prorocentrum cordatum]